MSVVEKNYGISAPDNDSVIISLDAMGGDNAPESVIKGASLALKQIPNLRYNIYGNKSKVSPIIGKYQNLNNHYKFIQADDVIDNDEKPSNALRKGKDSSMYMAINALRNGEVSAAVSSGNTGALMAISKLLLRTLPGIDRPAIGGILPTHKGYCAMLDLGANVHSEPENLFEFAVMGNAFARAVLGIATPSIGLLNVGAEKSKGNEVVKAAYDLIQESGVDLNLYGFIEGDDISFGTTDVVVVDGFSGNIALKSIEGLSKLYTKTIRSELMKDPLGWIAALFAIPAYRRLKNRMDPRNYNGAMLIGLNGIVVKSHGSTDDVGFANAIKVAYKLSKNNINQHISREMISSGHMLENDEEIDIE